MARRSIWETEYDEPQAKPPTGWLTPSDTDTCAPVVPLERPASILDQLRTADPKIKTVRNRSWEENNPGRTYRKVPNAIRDRLNQIAAAHGYNASQVAQAFLEYALMCYRRADFELELELDRRGLTLMPGGWTDEHKPIWAESVWGKPTTPKKKRRQKSGTPLYQQRVNYRLSPDLVENIDAVCEVQRSPDGAIASRKYHDGEVVARFLTFAIEAYSTGKLALRDAEDE
jgi:hypothetical protein